MNTGFDSSEGTQRNRQILMEPAQALAEISITPESIDTVIITYLHYDHAGGLEQFPNAHFHLQEAKMVYATGPCMCYWVLKPFSTKHICRMVRSTTRARWYSRWRCSDFVRRQRPQSGWV